MQARHEPPPDAAPVATSSCAAARRAVRALGLESRKLGEPPPTGGLRRCIQLCRRLSRSFLAFDLESCKLDTSRFLTVGLLSLRILRHTAGISRRRHQVFRGRSTWRYRKPGRRQGRSGTHDRRSPVGRLRIDRGRREDLRRRRVIRPFGRQGHLRTGLTSRGVSLCLGLCTRLDRKHIRHGLPAHAASARRWSRVRLSDNKCSIDDRCDDSPDDDLTVGTAGWRAPEQARRADRRLDPSISPGQGEARKPKAHATERQAQQQRVTQQGN